MSLFKNETLPGIGAGIILALSFVPACLANDQDPVQTVTKTVVVPAHRRNLSIPGNPGNQADHLAQIKARLKASKAAHTSHLPIDHVP